MSPAFLFFDFALSGLPAEVVDCGAGAGVSIGEPSAGLDLVAASVSSADCAQVGQLVRQQKRKNVAKTETGSILISHPAILVFRRNGQCGSQRPGDHQFRSRGKNNEVR